MKHLPTTYYRIGQPIQVDEIDQQRTIVFELSRNHIAFQFGQEREGVRYSCSVSPEFVKPILRPLSQIRLSHVIELFRLNNPNSNFSDDDILGYASQSHEVVEVWADNTQAVIWLMSLYYDVQGLIQKGLAVSDEA